MTHNAFITLEEVVVVWSQPDDAGTYMSSDFEDEQRKRLREEYSDEYAYEIGDGVLGQLWFERNTAVINMGEIVRIADEIATENADVVDIDPFFSFENQVQTGFLTTVFHELRHLQMDTNIFLPEDTYPLEFASENAVEEYCREAFEAHPMVAFVFAFFVLIIHRFCSCYFLKEIIYCILYLNCYNMDRAPSSF